MAILYFFIVLSGVTYEIELSKPFRSAAVCEEALDSLLIMMRQHSDLALAKGLEVAGGECIPVVEA